MEFGTFKLNGGDLMPLIGLGTLQLRGSKVKQVLDLALSVGYRSIDTAAVYGNEEDIGAALRELLPKHNLNREDIFITSKLPPSHHGEKVHASLKSSLLKLGCGYLNLYLIHWPGQQGTSPAAANNAQVRAETWRNLVEAQRAGLVRNIGVSNYMVKHLGELLANDFGVLPAVNQVEWHPYYHQPELKALCEKHGVLLEAYFSLGGANNSDLLRNNTVLEIAKRLNKEPSQILLRWATQQRVAVIPKASSRGHLESNINLNFEIPQADIDALNKLPQRKYAWDPTVVS